MEENKPIIATGDTINGQNVVVAGPPSKFDGYDNYDLLIFIEDENNTSDLKTQAAEQLLKQSPSNSDLCYIIRYTDLKTQAAEQLLKQSPSNSDLCYIIEYTDLKTQAWEQLLKQSPSNSDLCYIIEYTDLKTQAWEQLLKQSPSNSDLRYIIRYTDLKTQAWEQLLKLVGAKGIVDEKLLIKEIAENVLSRPGSLTMDKWHCGTSHCLAGWACILSPIAADIEKQWDTETAGDAVLPSYSKFFHSSNQEVLQLLKEAAAT